MKNKPLFSYLADAVCKSAELWDIYNNIELGLDLGINKMQTLNDIVETVGDKEVVIGICSACEERQYLVINGEMVSQKDIEARPRMKKYEGLYFATCLNPSCRSTRIYDKEQLDEMRR